MFDVQFVALAVYKAGEPVAVRMRLRNATRQDLLVFRWFTPLEGLWSDCLVVDSNGQTLAYIGPTVKRGYPTPDDYELIRVLETTETLVDVSRGYDMSRQ